MDVVNAPAGPERVTVVDTEENRRHGSHMDHDWARTAERVIADASRNAQFTQNEIRDNLEASNNGFFAARGDAKDGFYSVRGDLKDGFKDQAVQIAGVSKDIQILNKDLQITEKNLQLQASQNTAALQAAMAECCCELKELVRAEGSATRALIQTQTEQTLRDTILSLRVGVGIGAVAGPFVK